MIRRLTFIYITLSISFSALIKPIDDSTINYTHVLFEWEQINEAYSYQLQIATDSNFTNILTDINNESLIYIEKNNIDWNTQYYWRVRSLDGSDSPFGDWLISEFSTSQKRSNAEAITFNTSEVADGLTIFSSFFDYFSAVIDKNGDEIWNTGNNDLVYYINDNYGQLYGTKFDPNDSDLPGLKFSLDSEILWSETGESYVHHDIFQLPSQNYIGIAEKHQYGPIPEDIDYETLFLFEISGYPTYPSSDFFIFPWVGDEIIEWDKDGNIIWSWNTFDYLNWLEDYDLLGGVWDEGYDMGRFDWTHSNALWFDEQESTLLLSSRHLSRIIKIGYPSGDIIWQMGLDMPSGDIDCGQNLNFGFQHSLQVLDNGNILILDNGNISPQLYDTEYPTTRALEIAVTDTDNGCEAEIVWEYSLPENLFGFASGNAQKLDNGNYLITTVGGGATSLEIKPTGHNSGEIVWRGLYNLALPSGAAYRAHRIAGLNSRAWAAHIEVDFVIAPVRCHASGLGEQ